MHIAKASVGIVFACAFVLDRGTQTHFVVFFCPKLSFVSFAWFKGNYRDKGTIGLGDDTGCPFGRKRSNDGLGGNPFRMLEGEQALRSFWNIDTIMFIKSLGCFGKRTFTPEVNHRPLQRQRVASWRYLCLRTKRTKGRTSPGMSQHLLGDDNHSKK